MKLIGFRKAKCKWCLKVVRKTQAQRHAIKCEYFKAALKELRPTRKQVPVCPFCFNQFGTQKAVLTHVKKYHDLPSLRGDIWLSKDDQDRFKTQYARKKTA